MADTPAPDNDLLSRLLAETGVSKEEYAALEAQGRFIPGKEVTRGPEFRRIRDLPRRDWEPGAEAFAERLTAYLRAPGGTQKLRPVQAISLREAHDRGGLFGPQRVGAGKTNTSLLAATIMGARKPMLLIPAKLKDKTLRDMNAARKHWLVPPYIFIMSYELLGRPQSARALLDYVPDVIVADECFVGETHIRTDAGDVPIRDVVERGVGTYALSAKPETGNLAWRRIVRRIAVRGERPLVRVVHERGSFVCTEDHKIFVVKSGSRTGPAVGVGAAQLRQGDRLRFLPEACTGGEEGRKYGEDVFARVLCSSQGGEAQRSGGEQAYARCTSCRSDANVRLVLDRVPGEERQTAFLQSELFGEMDGEIPTYFAGGSTSQRQESISSYARQTGAETRRAYALEQSDAQPGGHCEDIGQTQGSYFPRTGRQRAADEASDHVGRGDRPVDGVPCSYRDCEGPLSESTPDLQGRLGPSRHEAGYRSGRQQPQHQEVAFPRSPENRDTQLSRVVRVEVQERTGLVGSDGRDLRDSRVYDLEVEGDHTYFADGVLVSNCHKLRYSTAVCTKRVKEYMRNYPSTRFVALSGTITKRSIKDYAHILDWCLRQNSPAPRDFQTLMEWSMALDETRDNERGLEAGALGELCDPTELALDPIRGVRKGYRRRLVQTPGVVATQEGALGVSLRIDPLIVKDPVITKISGEMKQKWERPDGVELIDAKEIWAYLRQIANGFYYRWNPAPPRHWRDARREWASFVRDVLRNNRRGLDSQKMVQDAVEAGEYERTYLDRWLKVKDEYDPEKNKEAVWLSTSVLDTCAAWAKENPGIIWTGFVEFGKVLSARTGLPYYANQGRDANKRVIEDHPPGTPMIASIASNGEGRNLQAWNCGLYPSWPTSGAACEQLIGRMHRDGQEADEVTAEIIATIPEILMDFDRSVSDARYITDTTGQEQKLYYADITVPPYHERSTLWTP